MPSPKAAVKTDDVTKRLRQKVQVLRAKVPTLAHDDDVWREFLALHAKGERSTRAMRKGQLDAVIKALHAAGAPKTRAKAAGDRPFPYVLTPPMKLARALWIDGARSGAIRNRTDAALAELIKRLTKIEVGLVPPDRMTRVIETIKQMVARAPAPGGS